MKIIKVKKCKTILPHLSIILVTSSIWLHWGNVSILKTEININSEKIPASFNGFRIIHVSDLHNEEFGHNQNKLLKAVKESSPNLIAVTGDLIDSRHTDVQKALDFINGAVDIAPVYYVTGNHESRIHQYEKFKKQMSEAGVIILNDKGTTIKWGVDSIRLLGLDDPAFTTNYNLSGGNEAIVDAKLKTMKNKSSHYTILLSHRPELFHVYADNRIDLILSGHAHGGQIRLPLIGGLFAPNQGFFPKYSEGLHEKNQTKMVVSRGLGNSLFPVRINNPPQLVVITLVSQQNL